MQVIQIIWMALKVIPDLIKLIRDIWFELEVTKSEIDSNKRAKEMKAAIKKSRETGDTSAIEKSFNSDRY